MFENFWKYVADKVRPYLIEEPPPPPPPPEEEEWMYWWHRDQPDWLREVNGMKVGYVKVCKDKAPLHMVNEKNIAVIYEDNSLREGTSTDAKRIIAKKDNWIMVYAKGDTYGYLNNNVRPFGQKIDGTGLYYLVMKEQIIDGISLWKEGQLPPLFLRADHIDTVLE